MSIKNSIDELDRIKAEIARNNAQNRALRKRASVLETHISEYLQSKSQAGVKYNGRTIVLERKERHGRKGKADKQRDTVALLHSTLISAVDTRFQLGKRNKIDFILFCIGILSDIKWNFSSSTGFRLL